ncbi:MAG TPA: DUF177 domain-containing protein [Candidatus Aminicenantes bacterium]|nr:DUF177 domain-containing protein [Candidatus Aminicenantes bacterium]HRY64150.1 DUF177 domain-containing protein [Candidatus Aminicenantes bacterium]HRZ71063.1 DUF177 domain-containing protein [Candidatus Aminicenantes bacterium]
MLIDIDRLPKEGLRVSRDFEFLSLDLVEENAVFLEPAHADVTVRLAGDEVYVQGQVTARLSFVCSRCLTPFEFPVASRFDLVYLPEDVDALSEELSDEKIDQMFYSDRQLDLRAVILEQLNLTFPAKPLCSPDCEGICAVCGEIIRDAHCSCLVKESNPRWNKLKLPVRDKS